MLIDHTKKLVYIAIPKTGSYSIHTYFNYVSGHPEPKIHHAGVRDIEEKHPETRSYYFFSFVRNPWDKLLSTYMDFTRRRGNQYSEHVFHDKPLLSEFKDFDEFCVGLKDSSWKDDIFFVPQTQLVTRETGQFIDFIGRFERFQEHFNLLCQVKNWSKTQLSHENKGHYSEGYKTFYKTQEAIDAVASFYKEDIQNFNYQYE